MATAYTDDFEDFITCGVCFCEYDDLNRKPKFLHCNARHTICLSCLKRINQNTTISCPFCRENFFSADVTSLPNNVYVLHMLKFNEHKGKKPTINGKVPSPMGTGVCPTCGSGIKNTGINSLATAIEKRREAQKQLGVVIKAIQAAEGEVKKLQEENDFKLTEMVSVVEAQTPQIPTMNTKIPAIVPIGKFVLSDDSLFILKIFQSGQLKGEIQINPHISPATKHFLKLLGQFCYKSPKNFNSTIDKAIPGCFVLMSMENPQFQPITTDIGNILSEEATDYGEIGIAFINVSTAWANQVTGWSFVFVLEERRNFVERDNLEDGVSNNELIGNVQVLQPMIELSRISKSARKSYAFTLESR